MNERENNKKPEWKRIEIMSDSTEDKKNRRDTEKGTEKETKHAGPASEAGVESTDQENSPQNEVTEEASGTEEIPEQQASNYLEKLQRLQAEFENFKKRTAKEKRAWRENVESSLLKKFLPIIDSFERAFESGDKVRNEDARSVLEGLKLIYNQFMSVLLNEGIEKIETVGEEFDPNLHEAVSTLHTDEYSDRMIVSEISSGYKRGDKVLIPARVVVNIKEESE